MAKSIQERVRAQIAKQDAAREAPAKAAQEKRMNQLGRQDTRYELGLEHGYDGAPPQFPRDKNYMLGHRQGEKSLYDEIAGIDITDF